MKKLLLITALSLITCQLSTAQQTNYKSGKYVQLTRTDSIQTQLMAAAQTIDIFGWLGNDLFAAAELISIDGYVTDDAILASRRATIRGTVGDLLAGAAETFIIDGEINGDVFVAGRMIRTLIEIETITADVINSFGIEVILLLSIVVLYFFYKGYRRRIGNRFSFDEIGNQIIQIPAYILIIGLPLAFSLCWTFGIAFVIYGNFNIMTATLGLLLFGMGIDFGIHFFARYTEQREKNESVAEASHSIWRSAAAGFTT
ncbi:hypothetical protein [Fodinibius halophilus]|uniref:Uncharacterized protein n=1 Tax=Fodinibius halophilus TaxID=1736908 RepID=A0A6M1T6T7_9BACT|nr:hypothetical protein [Fodinibius halophilus]NGP89887.1 hypothetical protein [Fodinibius halophilus]